VKASVMPAYPWLFEHKSKADPTDIVVSIPESFLEEKGTVVVASDKALKLVAYLQSLKQVELASAPEFLYKKGERTPTAGDAGQEVAGDAALDGATLYANNCQACHQANGEGLPGAFPSLKGSKIVTDEDPSLLVEVIIKGYNASDAFGEMPPIGVLNGLTAEEIAAIVNHERSSWGNNARPVSADEVREILRMLEVETNL